MKAALNRGSSLAFLAVGGGGIGGGGPVEDKEEVSTAYEDLRSLFVVVSFAAGGGGGGGDGVGGIEALRASIWMSVAVRRVPRSLVS